jgi:hypothetical protein
MTHFVGLEYTEKILENGNQNANPKRSHDDPSRPIVQEREEIIKDVTEELNSEAMEGVNEGDTENETTDWIEISRIRRYKAVIAAENVEGDTYTKKVNNVNKKISHLDDFMGTRIVYIQNKAHVCATYGQKEAMLAACDIALFEDNDFHLKPINNRGDEETKDRTVVVRDLPLDVNRQTLRTIMEKMGTVTDIKLQISGMWYKAYVTYEEKATVEDKFHDIWSIFYLKDFCRVAPANFTRQEIDERNKNTVKLTDLPFGTTAYDIRSLLDKVKAKTCFIPRTRNQYGRARYAYVTLADEESCVKLLNNEIQGVVNETTLFWVAQDVKTCHKCGGMDHLVIECKEKKEHDEFKERRKGYSNVYTRYRIPNYKNITKQNPKRTEYVTNKKTDNNNNINQQLLESMNTIQQTIKEMNVTLQYLNQRITKVEKQIGIKAPAQMSITTSSMQNNNNEQMEKHNTQQSQTPDKQIKIINKNENVWRKPVNMYKPTNNISGNKQQNERKRVRITTSSASESEAESSTVNKGKNIQKSQTLGTQEINELNEVKATQQNLEKQVNAISQQMATLISMLNANK